MASWVEVIGTWIISLLPGLIFVLMYLAYRRVLFGKLLTVRQVMAQQGVLDSYLNVFRQRNSDDHRDPERLVKELFDLYYHWRSYAFGLALNVAITLIAVLCILAHQGLPLGIPGKISELARQTPISLSAAFAGAYIWNMYDIVKRYRAGDLTPAAFHFSWIRLGAACVVGPLAATAAVEGAKPVIAFAFGLLPLQTVFDYFIGYANKRLGITSTTVQAAGPTLHNLQGLTEDMISQAAEGGIDSTQALAYCDPMKLFLKTNVEWVVIIDLIDQALLYNYIDTKLAALRPLGIRGSIETAVIWKRFLAGGDEATRAAELMVSISSALGITNGDAEVKNLIRTIYEDDQVNLIWQLFGGSFDHGSDQPETPIAKGAAQGD